ncbi:PREDICTED: uncharacterized protein LOC108798524 [Nanorana parkeri]|uniref:uncharacterized protein LOC108798524 n=1 Tax=Nanorana parkeri TaxID=125878 RepID=UPI000853F313|nr:PREDICTED: uncharacterized protein LOC108798524 [Nanorana parkeri]
MASQASRIPLSMRPSSGSPFPHDSLKSLTNGYQLLNGAILLQKRCKQCSSIEAYGDYSAGEGGAKGNYLRENMNTVSCHHCGEKRCKQCSSIEAYGDYSAGEGGAKGNYLRENMNTVSCHHCGETTAEEGETGVRTTWLRVSGLVYSIFVFDGKGLEAVAAYKPKLRCLLAMQSYNDAPVDVVRKLSVAEKNCQIKGKENCMTSSACLQQKPTAQNAVPHGPQQSKLPVLSKARAPPDFQKMHQSWQTHFQRGKAVSKKSCTRPQPFNFSQRREHSRVKIAGVKVSGESSSGQPSCNSPASCKSREPLSEVVVGQNKKESSVVMGGSEVDFKADPVALASILSNIGVSTAPVGKVSLAQRVPIRAASIAHPLSSKNTLNIQWYFGSQTLLFASKPEVQDFASVCELRIG